MKKDKYQKTIYNLVHLSKADMTDDGVCIDRKKLQEDIKVLWELYNNYQKLLDKEKPLTVNYIADGYADGYPVYDTAICRNCDRTFEIDYEENYKYCPDCGQKLDWSDEDDKNN